MANTATPMTPAEMAEKLRELQRAFAQSALDIANDTVAKLSALDSSLDLGAFDSAAKRAVSSMIGNISSSTNFVLPDIIKSLTPVAPLAVLTPPAAPTA